jgi:hypothetical protein
LEVVENRIEELEVQTAQRPWLYRDCEFLLSFESYQQMLDREQWWTNRHQLAASGTPLARHIIIDALRRLDAVSAGRFISGRHGYPTRFKWTVKSLQTRALARGDKAG